MSNLTSAGQKSVMVRRPGDRFHSGDMFGKGVNWLKRTQVPNKELVVVASGRQVLTVGRPLEAANFLPMTDL
jgi:hypothetical protein